MDKWMAPIYMVLSGSVAQKKRVPTSAFGGQETPTKEVVSSTEEPGKIRASGT